MHPRAGAPKDAKPREQWLVKLKDMDAFCHVVRAFEDEAVFHAAGSVDALRDIEVMTLELAITDLTLVDLRLERIAQEQKRKADARARRRKGAAGDAQAISGKRQIAAATIPCRRASSRRFARSSSSHSRAW